MHPNGVSDMKLPKSEKDFEELLKGIKWNRIIPPLVSVLQPVILFGLWLGFARMDKRADAVSKLIAIAEPIPTIDLNLPRPVVLASLYHSVDEALDVLKDVIEYIKDIEIPSADDIIDAAKEEITDPIAEAVEEALPDSPAFKQALADCVINAKDKLGIGYWLLGPAWIQGCMLRKGYSLSLKYVKDKLFG